MTHLTDPETALRHSYRYITSYRRFCMLGANVM